MPSIKSRIAALQKLVESWGAADFSRFLDDPPEDLDPISRSIVETVRELEALDTSEKKDVFCREHKTTPEEIDGLVRLFRTGCHDGGSAK